MYKNKNRWQTEFGPGGIWSVVLRALRCPTIRAKRVRVIAVFKASEQIIPVPSSDILFYYFKQEARIYSLTVNFLFGIKFRILNLKLRRQMF
jgi:hypothetical protein